MANDGMDFLDELDFSDSNSKDTIEKIAGFLPGPLGQYLAKGSPKQRKIKCAFISTICLVILLVILLISVTVIVIVVSSSSSDDTGDTTPPPPSDNSTTTPPPPPAVPTLPVIPKNFITTYTSTIFFGEIPNVISGTYMEDGEGGNRKLDYVAWLPGAYPDYPLNNTQIVNIETYQVSNDICRIIPVNYSDPFDWLEDEDTYFAGYVTIDGVDYAAWQQDDFDETTGSDYSIVLLANGNIPYQLNQTFTASYFNFSESLSFGSDFHEATFDGTEWDVPSSCTNELICDPINPGNATDEFVFYRYHSAFDWQLENRNFGDLKGVATFLCWSYMYGYNTDPSLEVVSYYDVLVNTAWGEYGKCNYNYCLGSDDSTVGQAATGGFTANAGQCSTNDDIGNWYSLTQITECSVYDYPSGGNCAWKLLEISQNITVDCLLESGFIDSCFSNPIIPFPDAVDVLNNAFATCPPVNENSFSSPPSQSEKLVVRSMKEEQFPPTPVFSVAKELYSQLFGFY